MKTLVLLLLLGFVAAFPQEPNPPISLGLKWFNESALGAEFRHGRFSGCGNEVKKCVICCHKIAAKCNDLWMQKPEVQSCVRNSQVAKLDKTIQRASFKYHQAMERCLAGQDPPPAPDEDSWRFKRHAAFDDLSSSQETMMCPAGSNFETAKECWDAMLEYLTYCRPKFVSCIPIVKCTWASSIDLLEPGPDREWYWAMELLHREKSRKVYRHKRKLRECLREEHGSAETWDSDSFPNFELPFEFLCRTGG